MPSFPFTLTLSATPDPATFRASLTSAAGRAEGRVVLSAALAAPIPSEKAALAERGAQLLMALRADPNLEGGLRAIVAASNGAPLQLLVATPPAPSRAALAPWELLCEPRYPPMLRRLGAATVRSLEGLPEADLRVSEAPRVLVAWSSPTGLPPLDGAFVAQGFGVIWGEAEVLTSPHNRLEGLRDTLINAKAEGRPVELLYVLSPGDSRAGEAAHGLTLEDADGAARHVTAAEFAAALRGVAPRLVVLAGANDGASCAGQITTGLGLLDTAGADVPSVIAAQLPLALEELGTLCQRIALFLRTFKGDPVAALDATRRSVDGLLWASLALLSRRNALGGPALGGPPLIRRAAVNLPRAQREALQDQAIQGVDQGAKILAMGQPKFAIERLRAASVVAVRAGSLAVESRAAADIGRAWMALHEPRKAHEQFVLALQLAEAASLPKATAMIYNGLGRVALSLGEPDRAVLFASRALRGNEEANHVEAQRADLSVLMSAWTERQEMMPFMFTVAHAVVLAERCKAPDRAALAGVLAELMPNEVEREQTKQTAREWMLEGFGEVEERLRGVEVFEGVGG
jgi:tetratricopeptide (TPR) repeat protein